MRESPDKDPKVTKRAPGATGRAPPAPQGASGASSSCRDPDGDSPSWMGVSWGRPRPSPCRYGREGVGEHPEVSRVASRACPLRLLPGPAPGVRNAQARTGGPGGGGAAAEGPTRAPLRPRRPWPRRLPAASPRRASRASPAPPPPPPPSASPARPHLPSAPPPTGPTRPTHRAGRAGRAAGRTPEPGPAGRRRAPRYTK